jgi:hypothetical protein
MPLGQSGNLLTLSRSSPLWGCKTRASLITINKFSSLDDVIDNCTADNDRPGPLYVFAEGPEANYLSKFIDSTACFINHIPAQLHGKKALLERGLPGLTRLLK